MVLSNRIHAEVVKTACNWKCMHLLTRFCCKVLFFKLFLALKMSIYYSKLFIIWNHSIVPKIYWQSFRLQLMSCSWPQNHIFKLSDWTKIFTLLFLIFFCAAYLLQETKCSLGSFIPCSLLSPSLASKRLIMSLFRPVLCLQTSAALHMWSERSM